MPWDVNDRRFRQVEKTLSDVGAQPIKPVDDGPEAGRLDLEATTRRQTEAKAASARGPTKSAEDLEVTRMASPRRAAFRVAGRWAGASASPGGVALVPVGRASGEAYSIAVRKEFRIGRSTGEADCVTWFLPRSPRNDALTRRISRVHATIACDGGRLWISDSGTANGTSIDGVMIKGRVAVPLTTHSEVVLAGEYKLIVDPLPLAFPNLEVEGLPSAPEDAPCGAVRFHAAEGAGPEPKPIWLLRQLAFGSGRGCGVRFQDDALEEVHGMCVLFGETVWIGVVAAGGGVWLDGIPLEQGELAPLKACRALKIGRFEYEVEGL